MERNTVLGLAYFQLTAIIGTAGLVMGSELAVWAGIVTCIPAVWFIARSSLAVVERAYRGNPEPEDYFLYHYVGVGLLSVGVSGMVQFHIEQFRFSMALPMVALGVVLTVGSLYEYIKRGCSYDG